MLSNFKRILYGDDLKIFNKLSGFLERILFLRKSSPGDKIKIIGFFSKNETENGENQIQQMKKEAVK